MRIYSLYKHKLRSHPTQSIIFLFLYFTCSYPTPENLENGNDQAARRWGKVSPRNPSRFSDMFTCALLIYLTCFVKFQTKQGKDRKGRKEKGKEEVDRILSLGNGGTRNGEGGGGFRRLHRVASCSPSHSLPVRVTTRLIVFSLLTRLTLITRTIWGDRMQTRQKVQRSSLMEGGI